jgi:hypothetical protein
LGGEKPHARSQKTVKVEKVLKERVFFAELLGFRALLLRV